MRAPRESLQVVGVVALATALLATAVQLQTVRENLYPPSAVVGESLYVTSGKTLRNLTIAVNALAADVYWIRTIQYYGSTHQRLARLASVSQPPPSIAWSSDYDQLYPLLDLTTSADPLFSMAYQFGSVFLGEAYPAGAGRPDLAIKLLEKGLRERPGKWEYMRDIGFVYYWYKNDYRAAATWFNQAASVPGAPWWLRPLAATTLATGGDRRSSRLMWQEIQQSADNDWLRKDAGRRLAQLGALDQIDELEKIVAAFSTNSGEVTTSWFPLVRARILRDVPRDPAGAPYEITEEGHVRMKSSSPLWPLPTEPAQTAVRPAP